MTTNAEYINFLEQNDLNYVWQFTKQETGFSNIFLSTKLYNEFMRNPSASNLEDFFTINHNTYGITDRHRTLIIAQMYGLITKYHSSYKDEEITEVFKALQNCSSIEKFKSLVSEQFLKFKLPAITYSRQSDTTNTRYVYPVIFIYQVLKKLKARRITSITIDELYTYVMTANFHSDVDTVVSLLSSAIRPIVNPILLSGYKGRSRIIPLLKNINLFKFSDNDKFISINPYYEVAMDEFLTNNLSKIMDSSLEDDDNYKHYLYTVQNFDINLIDGFENSYITEGLSNNDYYDDEYNTDILNAGPLVSSIQKTKVDIRRDGMIGALALSRGNYLCEYNDEHRTFIARSNGKQYMEAHHIIPFNQAEYIYNKHKVNIDCVENIVSLCPICHRAVHLGEFDTKLNILKKLYDMRIDAIHSIGLSKFSFEDLVKVYI